MAETNHTQGKWLKRYSSSFNTIIVEPEKGFGVIAAMSDRDPDSETEANADLIAAAPDLLEACQQAFLILAEHIEPSQESEIADICKAALNKAFNR